MLPRAFRPAPDPAHCDSPSGRRRSAGPAAAQPLATPNPEPPCYDELEVSTTGGINDGSAGLAGDGFHLLPGVAPLRPQEVAGAGADDREGHDRIPPCVGRAKSYVRP